MSPTRTQVEDPALILRGSLITWTRKCGKPGCRCTRGELHASPALSYSVAGVTKMLLLREEDRAVVHAALGRYQRAQAALERQVRRSVEKLRRRLARAKTAARTRGR